MKVTNTGSIFWRGHCWMDPKDPRQFEFWPLETTDDRTNSHLGVYVASATITIDVPDGFDHVTGQVQELQKELRILGAEFEKRKTEIFRKIQEVQAIEYDDPSMRPDDRL